jgi:hypothetical protein
VDAPGFRLYYPLDSFVSFGKVEALRGLDLTTETKGPAGGADVCLHLQAVQGGYIPVQGGYIPVQGGYIPQKME